MWIFFTLLEFISCGAAFILKVVTEIQSQQIFKANQKNSSEWGLFNSLSQSLTDLGVVTFYTFITAVLLISRIITKQRKHGVFEKLLLTIGAILFVIEGFLAFTSAEYVYTNIQVNSFIRGGLSILIACWFLIDVCCTSQLPEKGIQTDFQMVASSSHPQTSLNTKEKNPNQKVTTITLSQPARKCMKEHHRNMCDAKRVNFPQISQDGVEKRNGISEVPSMYLSTQL